MKSSILFPVLLVLAVGAVVPAAASQEEWNCNVHAYWGALGGSPADTGTYWGVRPGMTDGYDVGEDCFCDLLEYVTAETRRSFLSGLKKRRCQSGHYKTALEGGHLQPVEQSG